MLHKTSYLNPVSIAQLIGIMHYYIQKSRFESGKSQLFILKSEL